MNKSFLKLWGVLLFALAAGTCLAQNEKYFYRFPEASVKFSLLTPEISLETASENGSTFVLGLGTLFELDSAENVRPLYYVYAQYRYYLTWPKSAFLQDSERAEGLYAHGGAYIYQSQIDATSSAFLVGAGMGFQVYYGKYFFTDIFLSPSLAFLSNGVSIRAAPTFTGGIKVGIELTAFDKKE